MASANIGTSETSPSHKTRWYIPAPARFLVFVLLMQGVLFLSAHYRWFGFNERKGFTVLIAVAATAGLLLLLGVWIAISRFFRTKMQFGLATLLLMVVVMAIPCAWLAREMSLAHRQHEIVAAITAAGGNVGYSDLSPDVKPAPAWLEKIVGKDFVAYPISVFTSKATDQDLKNLAKLEHLIWLDLSSSQVTDAGLEHLKRLPEVVTVVLNRTAVTDAGLAHLKHLGKLRVLILHHTQINGTGLEHLQEHPELAWLKLTNTQVDDRGLAHIGRLKNVTWLELDGAPVTDDGIAYLKDLSKLQSVTLERTGVTDAGIAHLMSLGDLNHIALAGAAVTDEGVQRLQEALPKSKIGRTPRPIIEGN